MWKSRSSKGYTLIEVMASLSIFTIYFITIMNIYISMIKIKTYNYQINRFSAYIESLKNNIDYNLGYQELDEIFNSYLRYIDKENITLEATKNKKLKEMLVGKLPSDDVYIELNIIKEEIITVNAELHFISFGREETIRFTCYKGNYL